MEVTIKLQFSTGQRVWMPGGDGTRIKGRVTGITLFNADLTKNPDIIVHSSLNYRCIDERGNEYCFHEYQLKDRF